MTCAKLSAPNYKFLFSDLFLNRRVDEARQVLNYILNPNVYLYSIMVAGYVRNIGLDDALKMFDEMSIRDRVSWIQ